MKVFDEIRYQDQIVDYSRLNFIGSSKKYNFRFGNFMSLGNLAENIYNGNVSLDAAKQEQRKMENMLESFNDYNLMKNVYNDQKVNNLLNGGNFTKDKEKFSLLLKRICFHCLNHM